MISSEQTQRTTEPLGIMFRVGAHDLVCYADDILRVMEPAAVNRIPRLPEAVLGILHNRGRVYTIFDLNTLLFSAQPRETLQPGCRLLVPAYGNTPTAVVVDEVRGITTLPPRSPRSSDDVGLVDLETPSGHYRCVEPSHVVGLMKALLWRRI